MSRLAAAILALVCGSGCVAPGLAFREDDRVTVISPPDRALVSAPVTVEWRVRDFDVTGPTDSASPDAGYFGIFVDRAPPPPGRTAAWLFRDDTSCRPSDGCPDSKYLADRDIYTTTKLRFTIQNLRRLDPANTRRRKVLHEATIVLLDGRGRRIGESAYAAEFRMAEGPS